ncbi:hypothetical protein N431DRAFT_482855 [Stipitochalara longipes BDJ]|nr:hypothetical protein N431DRAFT_482855 [Stipitochalara longipes BDJ]
MPNDTAITRLLYAILSQKCLKDIDWNKVAHHPILCQEITNGHAARMRYSRFKKQMEGTATIRRPRGPNSPRKTKVEKSAKSPRKGKGKAKEEEEEEPVKMEPVSRQGTVESEHVSEREGTGRMEKRVKLEPGLALGGATTSFSESLPTPRTMPNTPTSSSQYAREASASPSPGPSERFEAGDMSEMDEMGFSFGMHGNDGLPGMYAAPPMMGEGMGPGFAGGFGMGMGMQMGLGDPYEGLWQGHGHAHGGHGGQGSGMPGGERGVHVKTEPRWEEAYRHT